MKKRLVTLLTTLVMCMAMVPMATFGAEKPWDGITVASSYAGGSGTAEDPYQIATSEQLAYLSKLCVDNNTEAVTDKYWVLTADIDLNGKNWTPIGTSPHRTYATGAFDGNNYKIKNLFIETKESTSRHDCWGLFGLFEGSITDLTVTGEMNFNNPENTATLSANYIGGIVGYAEADFVNCRSEVNITLNAALNSSVIGGLVGEVDFGTLENCLSTGTIKATSTIPYPMEIGGIAGIVYTGTINSCKNQGDVITAYGRVGGIAGDIFGGNDSKKVTISNCVNTANIKVNGNDRSSGIDNVGGIVGRASALENSSTLSVFNCLNRGTVTTTNSSTYAGPIYGFDPTLTITDPSKFAINNCFYINDAKTDKGTIVDNTATKKTIEETKTEEFLTTIAKDAKEYWAQAKDGTVVLAFEIADYTAVKAAIAGIPTDLSNYTDTSVEALNTAKNAVEYGLFSEEQETVDGYATAINKAVKDLVYKTADYTKVDAAIDSIPADLTIYTNETAKAVTDAKAAVIRDKNITEQETVDGYATAINKAVKGLVKFATYKDVPANHWAAASINDLTKKGLLSGYDDNTFRPEGEITRSEFCTIIALASGDEINLTTTTPAFADTKDHWGNAYILWAREHKIVKGYGKDNFMPDKNISREEAAVILNSYIENIWETSSAAELKPFTDVDKVSTWAKNAVANLQELDVINGYQDNSYRPQNSTNRAEAATMISAFFSLKK